MTARQPGRHTRREIAAMTAAQLQAVAATMTPEQHAALMRRLIEEDAGFAKRLINAAIAEAPVTPCGCWNASHLGHCIHTAPTTTTAPRMIP